MSKLGGEGDWARKRVIQDWTLELFMNQDFKHGQANLSSPRRLNTSAIMTQGTVTGVARSNAAEGSVLVVPAEATLWLRCDAVVLWRY